MALYRVSFVFNNILSVKKIEETLQFEGHIFYQHENGRMLFALVKADSETEVIAIVEDTIRQLQTAV